MDVFREAVSVVFGEWRALQLAVEQQFGGPDSREKAQWLEAVTVDFLRDNADVFSDELEEFLGTMMDQEFDTLLEDGSLAEVSKRIHELFTKCSNGQRKEVEEFILKKQQALKEEGGVVAVEAAVKELRLQDGDDKAPKQASAENVIDTPELDGSPRQEGEEWEVVSHSRRQSSAK